MITIDQLIIAVTGCASSWMIHSTDKKVRAWACAIAMVGQPAWIYAAYEANQWGIVLVDIIYTAGWIRGSITNWR